MTQSTIDTFDLSAYLVEIRAKDGSMKQYLPAAWRLYALRLWHPTITIESEIVLCDPERNLVVVKAWIFDGATYAESQHRASSYKQGLLSALDKVETGAKARAARDYGIGTELALDWDSEDVDASGNGNQPAPTLDEIKDAVKSRGLARNPQQWQQWKKKTIGRDIPDERLTAGQLRKMHQSLIAA